MSGLLLVQLDAYPGESLRGYLSRLCEANGLPYSSWIADAPAAASQLRGLIGNRLFGRVPTWLQNEVGAIVPPSNSKKTYILGGRARCCPKCLAESLYWRSEWEYALYTVCHRHGNLLIGRCQLCRAHLTWGRQRLDRCICGAEMKVWNTEQADNEARHLCARLAAAVAPAKGSDIAEACMFGLLPPKLSIDDVTNLIFLLGTYGERAPTPRKPGGRQVVDPVHAYGLVRVAAGMLANWPDSFHKLMRDIGGYGREDVVAYHPPSYFLAFVKALKKNRKSPALGFIWAEYETFMSDNWGRLVNRRHSWATQNQIDSQTYMTPLAAARALRIARHKIVELVDMKILSGQVKRTAGRRPFLLIEKSSLRNAEEFFSDQISFSSAALLLGLARGRIEELVVAGFLTVVTCRKTRLLSRQDIEAFIRRLSRNHREPEDEECGVCTAIILKSRLGINEFIPFIQAVDAGILRPIGPQEPTNRITELIFGELDFHRWHVTTQQLCSDTRFTVPESAERLGVKQEVAYQLVASGLLKATSGRVGRRKCLLITADAIRGFESDYISATKLADLGKTSSKAVVETLCGKGIRPVIGPCLGTGRQYFFRLGDISP